MPQDSFFGPMLLIKYCTAKTHAAMHAGNAAICCSRNNKEELYAVVDSEHLSFNAVMNVFGVISSN